MNIQDGWQFVVLSVKDPATAARAILSMNLGREVLWPALVLATILNTLIFAVSEAMMPAPPFFPAFLTSPLAYFAVVTLALVAFIFAVSLAGRLFDGKGRFEDVLAVLVWLQYLRLMVQVAVLVLAVTVPIASLVLVTVASLVGLYILLHFIATAHRFASLGRAAVTLIVAMLALGVAFSIFIAMVMAPTQGISGHV